VNKVAASVNDARLLALRAAPQMADQINAVAAGKVQPSGALGTVGKLLIDNPISKTVLGGLTIVDTPRRAIISGVRELVDAVDSDPRTQASFSEFFNQAKDVRYGFGTAFPMKGWGGRVVGFLGDVALDPLTYATFGATIPKNVAVKGGLFAGQSLRGALGVKTLAGAEGRFALARMAKVMGATDDVVRDVAAKGRIALPKQIADNMGIKRAGIYYFGTRVRVPLSGPIADVIQRGLVKTRLGFLSTDMGQRVGKKFALRGTRPGVDTSAQRFALATGQLSPEQAGAFVGEFAAQDIERGARSFAIDRAIKYSRPLFEDQEVEAVRGSVYRLLDTPQAKWAELGINPSPAELRAYEKIRPVFEQMHADVRAAFQSIDPEFQLGKIDDYLPHMATDNALKLMADEASPYAQDIRKYLTVNQTDNASSFRARNLSAGSDWFGQDGKFPALTQKDIDGGVQRLNQLFRERTGLQYDFFETDIKRIMERYAGYYGQQIGVSKYMEELFKSGLMQTAKEGIEFNESLLDIVNESVKRATNVMSASYKEAFDTGRELSTIFGEVFDWATKKKATVTRPVGPLQQEVDGLKEVLKGIPPVEVAAARLESAQAKLEMVKQQIQDAWIQFERQFDEQSAYLQMIKQQHDDLYEAHQKVSDTLAALIKEYPDALSDDAIEARTKGLRDQIEKLRMEMDTLDRKVVRVGRNWESIIEKQDKFIDNFAKYLSDPLIHTKKKGLRQFDIFGTPRFAQRGEMWTGLKKKQGEKLFSSWGSPSAAPDAKDLRKAFDPNSEFSVNELSSMSIQEVREIISGGFSSISDLRSLRKAVNWLVGADVVRNGGIVPTDADFFGRLERLKKLMNLANDVEKEFVGGGKAVGAAGKTQIEELATAVAAQNDIEATIKNIVRQIDENGDELEALMEKGIMATPEEGLRIRQLEKANAELVARKNMENIRYERAVRTVEVISSKQETVQRKEAFKVITGNNFRELAQDLSDAASEYYYHSQVTAMFKSVAEEAASVGLVPTEQMYNALVAHVSRFDLDLAQNMVQSIDQAETIMRAVRDRVSAYTGPNKSAYLVNEFFNIFDNLERKAEADILREVFPEIEGVIYKSQAGSLRKGRALFLNEGGDEIASQIDAAMRQFEIPFARGESPVAPLDVTPRKAAKRVRQERMGGEEFAAQMEEFGALSERDVRSLGSETADFDYRSGVIARNIDVIKTRLERTDLSPQERQTLEAITDKYDKAMVRIAKRRKDTNRRLKQLTGAASNRQNERIFSNIIKSGDAFGIAGSLGKAFNGGQYAIDSFFADLLGGNKFDVRLGYTREKIIGGKIREVEPAAEQFTNVFENEAGELIDSAGNKLSSNLEIIDPETGQPIPGSSPAKETKPSVLVRRRDSLMSKMYDRAAARYSKLRSLADDAEFIPTVQLREGTLNSKGDAAWVFSDTIKGPNAYANQLELYVNDLERRIKVLKPLQSEIKREEGKLKTAAGRVAEANLTEGQKSLLAKRRAAAKRAQRELDELTGSELHLRALERNKLNNFMYQLAALKPEEVSRINWGLASMDFGFPVSRSEVLSVNELMIKVQEENIRKLTKQLENIQQMSPRISTKSLRTRIADANAEINRLRGQIQAARGRAPTDFGFSADEFSSLWAKEYTPQEIGALRTEYAKLNSELNARVGQRATPVYEYWTAEKIGENDAAIAAVMERMQAINSELNQATSRDMALKKVKFLFDQFETPEFQIAIGASKPNASVEADRAVSRFLRAQGVKDSAYRTNARRAGLADIYDASPEALHLDEVEQAKEAIRLAEETAEGVYSRKKRLTAVRDQIRETIALKRREVKDLEIGRSISEINDILTGASEVTGKKVGRVTKQEPLKTAKEAKKALGREVKAERPELFKRDEAFFGTQKQLLDNELDEFQMRRRDIVQQIAKLEFDVLADRQAQLDAREAIKILQSIGDRQAAVLGLPSASKIRDRLTASAVLEKQMIALEETGAKAVAKSDKLAATLATRQKAVDKAKAAFDLSSTMRAPTEAKLESAQRVLAETKDLAKRNVKIRNGISKKDAAWTEGMDELIADASYIMPLIEGTEFEKPMRDALADYIRVKAMLQQNLLPLDAATQEKRILEGIQNMVATDADEALLNIRRLGAQPVSAGGPAGIAHAVNITKSFDEGFVQLSRYFPNVGVKKELAELVQNVHRAQDPAVVRELNKWLSKYTRFFKGYATLSPGFHIRNAMSNGFMLFAAGGNPRFLADGLKFSQSWTNASRRGVQFEKWLTSVPQAQRETVRQAMMAAAATGGGMTDEALSQGALWGTKTSKKVGQWMEQHSRFLLAYDGVRSGMDMNTAAARVRRYLIDYENVSGADQLLRQIIPFWMWTSRNLPMQITNIWMNPKAYQIYGSIKRNLQEDDEDVAVPSWMREMGAFKLPFGKNWYATPDFGFNRINQDIEQLRDPVRFASNLNPLLRLPIELMGNRQLYSGRPFSDQPVEVSGGVASILQPMLEGLGFGETGPTGKKFVDDRAYYALRSLIPTLSQAERLIPSTPEYQQRGILNPLLGYIGVPGRQVTPQMEESAIAAIQAQLREIAQRGKTLTEGE
jgi:hypothetical protein